MGENTKLLAIFNTTDDYLEGFWGMKRMELYRQLELCGFSAMTGATFSVTKESEKMPASHNIAMMLRHNQVIDEVGKTSLNPIPNIYWRGKTDRDKWSQWLNENKNVHSISRDFTLTKRSKKQFLMHFSGLLEILENVHRPIHVILIGVGIKWAIELRVIERLIEIGCTCSLLASDIVFYSKYGRRLIVGDNVMWEFNPKISKEGLFESNLKIAQKSILESIRPLFNPNKSTNSLLCVS